MGLNESPDPEPGIVIIGGGLAGQTAALFASERANVLLFANHPLSVSSSSWAQGGIAAALAPQDSPEAHFSDTITAGRGLCDIAAVEKLVNEAPAAIEQLAQWGVSFERDSQNYNLGREGGHSARRIVHAQGGATGKAVMDALSQRMLSHPKIKTRTGYEILSLEVDDGHCVGVWVLELATLRKFLINADAVMLAMGGASSLYHRTTNPVSSQGLGIAMAYNTGAELSNLEFVQFHPTALADEENGCALLISEAVRGEGAHLLNNNGERFMCNLHPQAELAPRDIVARAVAREIDQTGNVKLSLRHLDSINVKEKYYSLSTALEERGYDLAHDDIPVAPAAHYTIGGINTDMNGQSSIRNLYAIGEVASTGVHGANRLASNSLLECYVFGRSAALHATGCERHRGLRMREAGNLQQASPNELLALSKLGDALRTQMGRKVAITRSRRGLKDAMNLIASMREEVTSLAGTVEAQRMALQLTTAELIARAALERTETRGAHAREDYPEEDERWNRSTIQKLHSERSLLQTASS